MKQIYLLPILMLILYSVMIGNPLNNYYYETDEEYLENLRMVYYSGVENEEYIDSLKTLLTVKFGSDISNYPPVALAYKAGVEALKSKHAFWPFTKMTYLNESMDLFDKAVKKDSMNLEIRFMRFSILYYVPGILGYDNEEAEDLHIVYKLLLQNKFSDVEYAIQKGMAEFLLDSELLTFEQETTLINRFMLANNE